MRIAICQLESHPALTTTRTAYLEEPFLPKGEGLSGLGRRGVDVGVIKQTCSESYVAWSGARLASVLEYLSSVEPSPDVVVLPECSVPLRHLPVLAEWALRTGATLLGGSHTPNVGPAGRGIYRQAGAVTHEITKLSTHATRNVLPVFEGGRCHLIGKQTLSPFEREIVTPKRDDPARLRPVDVSGGKARLLPLLCSEALQDFQATKPYDLSAILSFDEKPNQFAPRAAVEVANRRPVIYCNDGRFGGSRVWAPDDKRSPNWLADAFPNGLPPGDALLIVDLDLEVTAVEVGIAAPDSAVRLVRLSPVIADEQLASKVDDIRRMLDSEARAGALADLLQSSASHDELARDGVLRRSLETLRSLEAQGIPCGDWWETLGTCCVFPGAKDLRSLEAELASACRELLLRRLEGIASGVAPAIMAFLAECQAAIGSRSPVPAAPPAPPEPPSTLDRERESKEVAQFIDGPCVILEVTGMPEIGKSSVIHKGVRSAGVRAGQVIRLTETSSLEYLLAAMLRRTAPASVPLRDLATSEAMAASLRQSKLVIVENAEHLLDGANWRDPSADDIVLGLVRTAQSCGAKIIVESRWALPLTLTNPGVRQPLRVFGLDRHRIEYGVELFDAQLRRVGLAPDVVSPEDKRTVVAKLAGHPVAVAIAADLCFAEGTSALLAAMKQQRGPLWTFAKRLLDALRLSADERRLLHLLCLPRAPIAREILLSAAGFSAAGSCLRSLIAGGAIEVNEQGLISGVRLLLEFLDRRDIDAAAAHRFHELAVAYFSARASRNDLLASIEAEYHAHLAGAHAPVASGFLDGALGSAISLFRSGDIASCGRIIDSLLVSRRSSPDVLRLAALVRAKQNRFDEALVLAREVLSLKADGNLLSDLAKIALTQFQDRYAEDLVELARRSRIENVSILIIQGRMMLRRQDLRAAEIAFDRARGLTDRNPWPYYFLGATLYRQGRLNEAADVLHSGLEFCAQRGAWASKAEDAIETQLGLVYLASEQFDVAAPLIANVLEREPNSPEAIR